MNDVRPITGRDIQIQRGNRTVLDVPNISVGRAACTALVGPNGAGKSLLIKTLSGLLTPDKGEIFWGAASPQESNRFRVGMLLQRPVLLQRSALSNVVYALRAAGVSRKEANLQARASLERAGLSELVDVSADHLSGGEQQRLALARALAVKPDMLFLDEATANVDPASTLAIERQLLTAIDAGLGVVFISHDMGQVNRLAQEVVLLHHGKVVEQCERTHFFEHTNNPVSRRWLTGEILV